jgi:1,4-alpha-glucan branching enzyme
MGGMGFNYKWNMGWMNDMLKYVSLDPVYRKWNHDKVTFSFMYAFSENFVLPLSHDEVVHGKCSLLSKMPGAPDQWRQFAGLRTFFAYWMAHPGKKLLFMGGEFGQYIEWNYEDSLDWHLPEEYPIHSKLLEYSKALNEFYCSHKALWQVDFDWNGFQWIDCDDNENSIVSFVRKAEDGNDYVIAVCNFTPESHTGYRIGVPEKGSYREVFNSDLEIYGGSDIKNDGDISSEDVVWHSREQSIVITVPPLATVYFRRSEAADEDEKRKPAVKKTTRRKAASEGTASETKAAAAKKTSTGTRKTAAKKTTSSTKKTVAEKKTASGAGKTATAKKAGTEGKKTTTAKRTTRKKAVEDKE